MTPSPVEAPVGPTTTPQRSSSEGGWKTILIASTVFLGVAGASFAYLRYSQTSADKQPAAHANTDIDSGKSRSVDLQRECLLENVGSVSSIYLYQSYLNVGLLADAVENQTYTKQHASEVLSTMTTLVQTVDGQMEKLERVGLDDEEMDSIKQVRDISKLLKSQADHLQRHWQTGDKASLDAFHLARQKSWQELRNILGLSELADKGS